MRYAGHILLHSVISQETDADPAAKQAIMENMAQFRDWLNRMPWKTGASPFSAVPNLEKIFFEVYTRGEYDDFWKHRCVNWQEHYGEYADVPTYYETGWYDS